jgi:hypothetical protein
VQEQHSEQSLQALNKLVPYHCHVMREGHTFHILANELVPGDIITFATGDCIPADIRIVLAVDLEVDESSPMGAQEGHRDICVQQGQGQRLGRAGAHRAHGARVHCAHGLSELRDSDPTTTVNNKTKEDKEKREGTYAKIKPPLHRR